MTYKIGLNNVPDDRTEDEIRKVFAPFGKILSVTFPLNKKTGERLGLAQVEYASKEDAVKAYLALEGDYLGGEEPIRITFHHSGLQDGADRGYLGSFAGKRERHF